MKQFKELSIDEQLDLVKHVLDGGKLEVFESDWHIDDNQCESYIHINTEDNYRKMSDTLQMLYHEADIIQSKIDEELKRLGEPVTRDNTSPVQSPYEQEKTSNTKSLERITLENWKSLGIKVGDKVLFEKVDYYNLSERAYTIHYLESYHYNRRMFIEFKECWWDYKDSDVAYLIRTKEGSLG